MTAFPFDDEFDPEIHDRPDDLGPSDEDDDSDYAYAVWDAQRGEWRDV